ncbi:GWxTD domain-containing protein [Acidobacteria bacterium AH-259-O06]|nr:GWxTD domain-containing protein [Acidobacteria bacterium AH-259-O06]
MEGYKLMEGIRWITRTLLQASAFTFGKSTLRPLVLILALVLPTFSENLGFAQTHRSARPESVRQEEQEDYFKKWLSKDVAYIIIEDEKKVFESLTTPEEKEQFIEQFWYRRDPDPRRPTNEFKEEHYRRIAYANERFSVGQPGWMSDRGRIYIIHGPPDEIQSHPTGGQYQRPSWEGGGWTQTYPFEIWRYRHIEGIDSDVEVEFVDRSLSGQYRLALNPEEKDALLHMGRAGPTLAEILRLENKGDRPYFNPANRDSRFQRRRDTPFERYARFAKIQSPTPIKFKDLKEIVKIKVAYNNLAFKVRKDYFQLNEGEVLVPITLELADKDLTFKKDGSLRTAEVAVYGVITNITNRIVQEFEDVLETSYQPQDNQKIGTGRSLYQKVVFLNKRMRYRLDLVVKDLHGGQIGVVRTGIVPPRYDSEAFSVSSLVLSNFIRMLEEVPKDNPMFVLGDVWIHPSLTNVFSLDRPLFVYFHLYHAAVDQTSGAPSVRVSYRISREGQTVVELVDESGQSIQYYSPQRMVLIRDLPGQNLQPGRYRLEVEIRDRIADAKAMASADFELVAPEMRAASK